MAEWPCAIGAISRIVDPRAFSLMCVNKLVAPGVDWYGDLLTKRQETCRIEGAVIPNSLDLASTTLACGYQCKDHYDGYYSENFHEVYRLKPRNLKHGCKTLHPHFAMSEFVNHAMKMGSVSDAVLEQGRLCFPQAVLHANDQSYCLDAYRQFLSVHPFYWPWNWPAKHNLKGPATGETSHFEWDEHHIHIPEILCADLAFYSHDGDYHPGPWSGKEHPVPFTCDQLFEWDAAMFLPEDGFIYVPSTQFKNFKDLVVQAKINFWRFGAHSTALNYHPSILRMGEILPGGTYDIFGCGEQGTKTNKQGTPLVGTYLHKCFSMDLYNDDVMLPTVHMHGDGGLITHKVLNYGGWVQIPAVKRSGWHMCTAFIVMYPEGRGLTASNKTDQVIVRHYEAVIVGLYIQIGIPWPLGTPITVPFCRAEMMIQQGHQVTLPYCMCLGDSMAKEGHYWGLTEVCPFTIHLAVWFRINGNMQEEYGPDGICLRTAQQVLNRVWEHVQKCNEMICHFDHRILTPAHHVLSELEPDPKRWSIWLVRCIIATFARTEQEKPPNSFCFRTAKMNPECTQGLDTGNDIQSYLHLVTFFSELSDQIVETGRQIIDMTYVHELWTLVGAKRDGPQ